MIARQPVAVACIAAFLCFLPFMLTRDFTPDNELRYVEIADEALSDGHVFAFTLNGEPYADKPPLYLWLVMLLRLLAGRHVVFLLSLLSLVPAFVTVWTMDRWLRMEKEVSSLGRFALALVLLTSGMFLGSSVFLRMDQMMGMFIVLALFSFYKWYTGKGNPRVERWMFPVWTFLALFTKGPVGLLMPLLSVGVFLFLERISRRNAAPAIVPAAPHYLGFRTFGTLLVLSALWLLCVWIEGGSDYLYNLTVHQTVGRAANAFTHSEPFYYYCWGIFVDLAPWCLLIVPVVVAGLFRTRRPLEADRRDNPAWIRTLLSVTIWILMAVSAVCTIGLAAAKITRCNDILRLVADAPYLLSLKVIAGAALLLAASVLALRLLRRGLAAPAIVSAASGILALVLCAGLAMDQINPYIGYGDLCSKVPAGSNVATLNIRRPENMKVYLGKPITDFGKKPEEFMAAFRNGDAAQFDVLLIKTSKLDSNPDLQAFLSPHTSDTITSGPYTAVLLHP